MYFHFDDLQCKNYLITYKLKDLSHDILNLLQLLLYQNPAGRLWLTLGKRVLVYY